MSEIQRIPSLVMQRLVEPTPDGDLVLYDDHAASLRQRDERIETLEKALRNLCDSIESAGGHDENGDVFDLTEAIVALETK